jgi:hypothetical protein
MRPSLNEVTQYLNTQVGFEATPEGDAKESIVNILSLLPAYHFLAADGAYLCRYCVLREVDRTAPATIEPYPAYADVQWRIIGAQVPEADDSCAHCGADLSPAQTPASISTSSES